MFNNKFLGHSIFSEPYQSYPLNIIPLRSIFQTIEMNPHALYQVVGNLLMLIPFAFAVMYFGLTNNSKKVILYFGLCSIAIELFQFLQSYIASYFHSDVRRTDVDDIILNTIGGIIGVIAYKIWTKLYCFIQKNKHQAMKP